MDMKTNFWEKIAERLSPGGYVIILFTRAKVDSIENFAKEVYEKSNLQLYKVHQFKKEQRIDAINIYLYFQKQN